MKQETFIARHQAEWLQFESWLALRGEMVSRARGRERSGDEVEGLRDEDMPTRYRRLCQQLSLARRRGYSPVVTERLQQLTQRGHAVLYRAAPPQWWRALEFVFAEFPSLVRAQRGCLLVAFLLFAVPLFGAYIAVQQSPELIYTIQDPASVAQFEKMYDPADPERAIGRESGTDVAMFGFYIMNNVSVALRTFAAGLLAGIGSMVVLVINGLQGGAIASHLQNIGHGDPFWRFVPGHSAPELTAIVISGAAGLRLGLDLIAPGRRRRVDALIEAGRDGAKLCLGAFLMLVFAAFIEAFWSSIGWMPAWIKFTVGGVLWTLTLLWLSLGGRGWRAGMSLPGASLPGTPTGAEGRDAA